MRLLNGLRQAVVICVLSLGGAVVAVPEVAAQTYQFTTFDVEGNLRLDTATIQSLSGIARGQTLSAGELNAAVQRVRDSGFFESVSVSTNGNRLVLNVVEFPTVNQVEFEGNNRLKDDALLRIVRSLPRRVFNASIAEEDTQRIAQAYADQGRLTASVTPKIIRRSDNRVDLVYDITEGGVVEITRIGFVGNRSFSDRRLRSVLESKQAGIFRTLVKRDSFIEDRVAFDQQVLRDFYQSRGYVDFQTLGVTSELTPERDGFLLTFLSLIHI